MLHALHIKNFGLISEVSISFQKGMNIITGETGAGKSMLIEALSLTLGKRADASSLLNKEAKCIIEAEFSIGHYQLQDFFAANDLDYEDETLLRREITVSGKSRSFINDTPVNLKLLSALGSRLIEIHSQHDNLQLFQNDFQFKSLDVLAGTYQSYLEYSQNFVEYKTQAQKLSELLAEEARLKKEADFKQFLFEELQASNLDQIDEEGIQREQELLENADALITTFNNADQIIGGQDLSIISQLQSLLGMLKGGQTSITKRLEERLKSVLIDLQDIALDISSAAQEVEVNPERLELVNEQLASLFNLRSKHNVEDVQGLIALRDSLAQELDKTATMSEDISSLQATMQLNEKKLLGLANNLSVGRRKAAPEIELKINEALSRVGMEHSRLRFTLTETVNLSSQGTDTLSLDLSSDKGLNFSPVKKAASGGELSRINLCLKNALAQHIQMPSSIFDEIDTGVSGEVARKVGGMMEDISQKQQVIAITHLPQIASLGDHHLFVHKEDNNDRIETQVSSLDQDARIEEIAKMISGANLTEHAVEQSKDLLGNRFN